MMMCNAIEVVAAQLPLHNSLKLHQLNDQQAFQNSTAKYRKQQQSSHH
jgi:hypothetical protein